MSQLDKLLSTLLASGIQRDNNALYQVISSLIAAVKQIQKQILALVTQNSGTITDISKGDFVTSADDSVLLPNSRQLTAGSNITLDDTTPGEIIINAASGGGSGLPFIIIVDTVVENQSSDSVSQSLEIAAGIKLEIDDTSRVEIVGAANGSEIGYLELSVESQNGTTINLSTLGTIDYFFPASITNPPPVTSHAKPAGGWIYRSFAWALNTATIFSFANTALLSTTAGDDIGATATNVGTTPGITANVNSMGWAFRAPVLTTQQIMRILGGSFGCDVLLTLSFSNNIAKPISFLVRETSNTAGLGLGYLMKIKYFGSPCDLVVKASTLNKVRTDPNMSFQAAWIASN